MLRGTSQFLWSLTDSSVRERSLFINRFANVRTAALFEQRSKTRHALLSRTRLTVARYIHDPYNPTLPPTRVLTTRQRIEAVAEVIAAQHPYYLCQTFLSDGRLLSRGVMLFQSTNTWHWFDIDGSTASGRTPAKAYQGGGLGDVIDNDRQLATYCGAVLIRTLDAST